METDFLVVGSGLAGLNFALRAAEFGRVTLLSKKKLSIGNTSLAQGGIAAVMDTADSFDIHKEDTLQAGAFRNREESVDFLVKNGPKAIKRLESLGVEFDKKGNSFDLTREGGHSFRRILFSKDKTGREIETKLLKKLRGSNVEILENTFALDLIIERGGCLGMQVIFDGKVEPIFSKMVILATGGYGMIFEKTTNSEVATGDGVAMAIRAGVKTKDLEFIQFHPTVLNLPEAPCFLLSEALRGEGAYLLNEKDERFMKKVSPLAELSPRDLVSRAVFSEKKAYLDISHKDAREVKNHFPTISRKLKEYNLDLAKDKIPISPAAHYTCGGIVTDTLGRTSLKNLLAYGEVACTGVHGANRLASNSLLEAVVFSNSFDFSKQQISKKIRKKSLNLPKVHRSFFGKKIRKNLRKMNWEKLGIMRKTENIKKLLGELQELEREIKKYPLSTGKIETENMILVSRAVAQAALSRKKSLGTHFWA